MSTNQLTQIDSLLRIGDFAFQQGNASLVASEVTYTCETCGVIEPRVCVNGYLRRMCACESSQREKVALEQVRQQAADYRASRCYSWLGKITYHRLESHTFANFNPGVQVTPEEDFRPKFRGNKAEAMRYARKIIDKTFAGNLLLRGNPGTGKTHLACAILNECRAQHIPCLYCNVQDLFNVDFETLEQARERTRTTPLLVLNDIDKVFIKRLREEDREHEGEWQKLLLFNIIDGRYTAELPTIVTTNAQGSLLKWLREESVSRLMEHMTVLDMSGIDYRLPRGGKQ